MNVYLPTAVRMPWPRINTYLYMSPAPHQRALQLAAGQARAGHDMYNAHRAAVHIYIYIYIKLACASNGYRSGSNKDLSKRCVCSSRSRSGLDLALHVHAQY